MYVRVIPMFNFGASGAVVAAIHWSPGFENRMLAIESLGESSGNGFECFEVISAEEVAMRKPSPLEGPLKQFHALLAGGKVFKGHRRPI